MTHGTIDPCSHGQSHTMESAFHLPQPLSRNPYRICCQFNGDFDSPFQLCRDYSHPSEYHAISVADLQNSIGGGGSVATEVRRSIQFSHHPLQLVTAAVISISMATPLGAPCTIDNRSHEYFCLLVQTRKKKRRMKEENIV